MLQVKIVGNYRYQLVEEEFNQWAAQERPFIIKSILSTTVVPKQDGGNSLYFSLAIFYNVEPTKYPQESEILQRPRATEEIDRQKVTAHATH